MLRRDWLTTGALITYPRSLISTDVIEFLVRELDDVVVVSDRPASDICTVVSYEDAITLTHTGIVIFDNSQLFAVITPLLPDHPQYKIILLTTWGLTLRQLVSITEKFAGLPLFNLNTSDEVPIMWELKTAPLSQLQLLYYNRAREEEIAAPVSNSIISYPITRMLTLYTYPNEIMLKTLTRGTTCKPLEQLFTPTSTNDLSQTGPKLLSLLNEVISNRPAKQIIVTRFNHYYGSDLITQFLKLIMNKSEIYSMSCSDTNMVQIVTSFNKACTGVLVTNVIPCIPIQADIIHIIDTYSFLTIQGLLSRLINRDVYIYSYVATHPHELSSDEALYNNLVGYITEVNNVYTTLCKWGTNLL